MSPCEWEKLAAQLDGEEEALEYDKYAIKSYKKVEDDCYKLVSHVPAKISSLLYYHFLRASDENYAEAEIIGKRKRQVGLVVAIKCNVFTAKRQTPEILDAELSKPKK